MPHFRQLAAIMFTDIVGYTALMGKDEELAFELLVKNRELHQPLIQKYRGTWIKEIGDSELASFQTVYDAVLCAGDIQQSAASVPGLQLRIGIHLGDVIFENNDVFGDGVNIASRLQTICDPGSIYVSDSVYNSIGNKKGIEAIFLREEVLKNVKDPVRIFELKVDMSTVVSAGIDPSQSSRPDPKASQPNPGKSVAVLPFVNMSNDPEQEYFSDGIAEEIINSLAHIKDLKTAGRTSSFQFKGTNTDLRAIGEKLNVRSILEGSVRRQGIRLRITAQLINAEDGYHLWSERYDRDLDDIFAIQDEIALAITEKLKISLMEGEIAIIQKAPTRNHEAYDLYLKGRFYLNKRGAGIRKALQYFQEAVNKDPQLALAYTGMADVYCILALYSSVPAHVGMPKAREHAEKALEIEPGLVEAHTALAFISTFYDWNWKEASNQFKYVLHLKNDYAPAHYWYSYYLSFVARNMDEGIAQAKKAKALEPLGQVAPHILSMMYNNAGLFEEGVEASRESIELDEKFFPGYRSLGINLAGLGRYEEAIEALNTAVELALRHPIALVELCWVYSLTKNEAATKKILDEFHQRAGTEFISFMFLGCVAYFAGEKEKALEYIIKAYEERESTFPCIRTYPLFYFFREDPDFQGFIGKMNFPD